MTEARSPRGAPLTGPTNCCAAPSGASLQLFTAVLVATAPSSRATVRMSPPSSGCSTATVHVPLAGPRPATRTSPPTLTHAPVAPAASSSSATTSAARPRPMPSRRSTSVPAGTTTVCWVRSTRRPFRPGRRGAGALVGDGSSARSPARARPAATRTGATEASYRPPVTTQACRARSNASAVSAATFVGSPSAALARATSLSGSARSQRASSSARRTSAPASSRSESSPSTRRWVSVPMAWKKRSTSTVTSWCIGAGHTETFSGPAAAGRSCSPERCGPSEPEQRARATVAPLMYPIGAPPTRPCPPDGRRHGRR